MVTHRLFRTILFDLDRVAGAGDKAERGLTAEAQWAEKELDLQVLRASGGAYYRFNSGTITRAVSSRARGKQVEQ